MNAVPLRRIVVGVNGSDSSQAALRWAAGEARLRRARLLVVHVWDRTRRQIAPYAALGGRPTAAQDRSAARIRLTRAVRAAFGSATPADVTTELAEGLVARVLIDRAADAELLVLGSTVTVRSLDAAPSAAATAGPVARACVTRTTCPLVIVTAPAPSPNAVTGRDGDIADIAGVATDASEVTRTST
ncbi:MAG TPA: universal stress protein [Streptosporangiaceae bacterium]|nr:universal stress protein [Streptosporangiaceae bacterium]